MDMFSTVTTFEAELSLHGLKDRSMGEGKVIFGQMQCMHNVVYNYLKMPGPLLGVGTEANKLKCGTGSPLDADEKEATKAIGKMVSKWVDWEQESGIDHAIRAKNKATRIAAEKKERRAEKNAEKARIAAEEEKKNAEKNAEKARIAAGEEKKNAEKNAEKARIEAGEETKKAEKAKAAGAQETVLSDIQSGINQILALLKGEDQPIEDTN